MKTRKVFTISYRSNKSTEKYTVTCSANILNLYVPELNNEDATSFLKDLSYNIIARILILGNQAPSSTFIGGVYKDKLQPNKPQSFSFWSMDSNSEAKFIHNYTLEDFTPDNLSTEKKIITQFDIDNIKKNLIIEYSEQPESERFELPGELKPLTNSYLQQFYNQEKTVNDVSDIVFSSEKPPLVDEFGFEPFFEPINLTNCGEKKSIEELTKRFPEYSVSKYLAQVSEVRKLLDKEQNKLLDKSREIIKNLNTTISSKTEISDTALPKETNNDSNFQEYTKFVVSNLKAEYQKLDTVWKNKKNELLVATEQNASQYKLLLENLNFGNTIELRRYIALSIIKMLRAAALDYIRIFWEEAKYESVLNKTSDAVIAVSSTIYSYLWLKSEDTVTTKDNKENSKEEKAKNNRLQKVNSMIEKFLGIVVFNLIGHVSSLQYSYDKKITFTEEFINIAKNNGITLDKNLVAIPISKWPLNALQVLINTILSNCYKTTYATSVQITIDQLDKLNQELGKIIKALLMGDALSLTEINKDDSTQKKYYLKTKLKERLEKIAKELRLQKIKDNTLTDKLSGIEKFLIQLKEIDTELVTQEEIEKFQASTLFEPFNIVSSYRSCYCTLSPIVLAIDADADYCENQEVQQKMLASLQGTYSNKLSIQLTESEKKACQDFELKCQSAQQNVNNFSEILKLKKIFEENEKNAKVLYKKINPNLVTTTITGMPPNKESKDLGSKSILDSIKDKLPENCSFKEINDQLVKFVEELQAQNQAEIQKAGSSYLLLNDINGTGYEVENNFNNIKTNEEISDTDIESFKKIVEKSQPVISTIQKSQEVIQKNKEIYDNLINEIKLFQQIDNALTTINTESQNENLDNSENIDVRYLNQKKTFFNLLIEKVNNEIKTITKKEIEISEISEKLPKSFVAALRLKCNDALKKLENYKLQIENKDKELRARLLCHLIASIVFDMNIWGEKNFISGNIKFDGDNYKVPKIIQELMLIFKKDPEWQTNGKIAINVLSNITKTMNAHLDQKVPDKVKVISAKDFCRQVLNLDNNWEGVKKVCVLRTDANLKFVNSSDLNAVHIQENNKLQKNQERNQTNLEQLIAQADDKKTLQIKKVNETKPKKEGFWKRNSSKIFVGSIIGGALLGAGFVVATGGTGLLALAAAGIGIGIGFGISAILCKIQDASNKKNVSKKENIINVDISGREQFDNQSNDKQVSNCQHLQSTPTEKQSSTSLINTVTESAKGGKNEVENSENDIQTSIPTQIVTTNNQVNNSLTNLIFLAENKDELHKSNAAKKEVKQQPIPREAEAEAIYNWFNDKFKISETNRKRKIILKGDQEQRRNILTILSRVTDYARNTNLSSNTLNEDLKLFWAYQKMKTKPRLVNTPAIAGGTETSKQASSLWIRSATNNGTTRNASNDTGERILSMSP